MILSVHCLAITPIDSRPIVQIETSMGIVIIRLFPDESPITCENFLSYVNEGFYEVINYYCTYFKLWYVIYY